MMPAHAPTAPMDGPPRQHLVGEDRHGIGQQALLREPNSEQTHPLAEPAKALSPVENLLLDSRVANDWPRHQLREHRYVHPEVERVALRRDVRSVHVDHVAHGLQRVEADAYGERQLKIGDHGGAEEGVQVLGEEPLVLEEPEDGEIEGEARREPQAPVRASLTDFQAERPVGEHGSHHQDHVDGLPPGVKNQG